MVVSATRGQAGQIRDAAAGNRRTIAAVREAELRLACERLGITRVRCLDHVDGTLADAGFSALVDEVAEVIGEFRPDIVITFGPDGGYGHPNHVTISAVTTAACQRPPARPPPGPGGSPAPAQAAPAVLPVLPAGRPADHGAAGGLADRLPGRFAGTPAFAHALLLLAEAARTMGHIRNHVQVRWYPPGSYVVEQGEVAAELFLILSGEAEMWQQSNGGRRDRLGRLGRGSSSASSASPGVGRAAATWSPPPASPAWSCPRHRQPTSLAGAREPAWPVPCPARRRARPLRPETCGPVRASSPCDVSEQVIRKVEALSAYRSQFPLEPDMFPEFLLREIFGREYFMAAPAGRPAHLDEVPSEPLSEPEPSALAPAR